MRYIVGIDLGTTNSCVAYIDTQDPKLEVKSFRIPQITTVGGVESLPTLPSFCYLPSVNEFPDHSLKLPWNGKHTPARDFFVGSFAKKQGARVPTRLVQSAKSWLCHAAADRRDKILPVEAADVSSRMSPVEASAHYLAHVRASWNEVMAKQDETATFDEQEVILTVPASFDEVARALTVEAAKKAGFVQMTLLEEPQAAFYSWIAQYEGVWKGQGQGQGFPRSGSRILVCDVGGGTTDFSLIEVGEAEEKLSFSRMAVGDHLLLGGDNMDIAVAHFLEHKLPSKGDELTSTQRRQLFHEARTAKEKLLSEGGESSCRIILHGEGSSVIKGSLSFEVTRGEIQELLLKGFFGKYTWHDALQLRKTSGFRSMGLPYEDEPSIVKHMARFLSENAPSKDVPIRPDFILFNGGAMKPQLFQEAIVANLNEWGGRECQVLNTYHLDLAVARGAAYFGKARRGLGVKIGGGIPRSYYLILDTKNSEGKLEKKALTLIPRGSEEGHRFEPEMTFQLTPNTPVSFQLASSHVRLTDQLGDLITPNAEEMHFLPPIHTVLRFGRKQEKEQQEKIPVHLHIALTPIGTLEIGLKALNTDHRWALEFQLKAASGQDTQFEESKISSQIDQTFDSDYLKEAEALLEQVFSPGSIVKPAQLTERLESVLGMGRREWPLSVMRGLADILLKTAARRKVSAALGERWWNLIGFLLRPGFGYPLDDFRLKELWKEILSDSKAQLSPELQLQLWICYRRIAGGLNKGQQTQIASDLLATLFSRRTGKLEVITKAEAYSYSEKIRTLASFEWLEVATKIRIGNALVERIESGLASAADYWALGRIGARHLIYGSLIYVVPREICESWIDRILKVSCKEEEHRLFLLEQLARKTEHRELNVGSGHVKAILEQYVDYPHHGRLSDLLTQEQRLTQKEQEVLFGEQLPAGLLLEE